MSDDIREILLDLPLVDTPDRPEGMLVLRRSEVPAERREEADRFVVSNGGMIGEKPLFEVIGGTTPAGGAATETFYALPPAALVAQ
ncbi:MAG TPA: hypothetical protein VG474_17065 [Solirubrobacteraceae bacterium]|nr:hypothetical protein [Solirubrobacteraceae bacterium]